MFIHTCGFKVNQLPSWTGHGWSLIAGGSITRRVQGRPDEYEKRRDDGWIFESYFKIHKKVEKYLKRGYFLGAFYNIVGDTIIKLGDPDGQSAYVDELNGFLAPDYSLDIFFFDFMGKSGRFWLGNDGEWKVLSDDNLCVEFDVDDKSNYILPFYGTLPSTGEPMPKVIKGFTIIDENGIKYKFGGDIGSIEFSMNLGHAYHGNTNQSWEAKTWMLTSVEDRFGNELFRLNYCRDKFIVQICNAWFAETGNPTVATGSITDSYSATINSPVYLESIRSMSGMNVSFERETAYPGKIASRILYPTFYDSEGVSRKLFSAYHQGGAYGFYYLGYTKDDKFNSYMANKDVDKTKDPLSSMDIMLLKSIAVSQDNSIISSYKLNYSNENRVHLTSLDIESSSNGSSSIMKQRYSFSVW